MNTGYLRGYMEKTGSLADMLRRIMSAYGGRSGVYDENPYGEVSYGGGISSPNDAAPATAIGRKKYLENG